MRQKKVWSERGKDPSHTTPEITVISAASRARALMRVKEEFHRGRRPMKEHYEAKADCVFRRSLNSVPDATMTLQPSHWEAESLIPFSLDQSGMVSQLYLFSRHPATLL